MEDLPENFYETGLYLRKGEELESGMTQKMFIVSISNEDLNNFIIKATNSDEQEEENYILHLKYSDYITKVNRDFTRSFNSLKLFFDKLKSCLENEKVVVVKKTSYSIKIIFFINKKTLPFELFPNFYSPSEEPLKLSDREYKAELIKYDKKLEDFGDRYIVKCQIENVGTTTWDNNITSLVCLPEYSSFICNEYFFRDEVIPNEQVDVELEFLKNDEILKPPFFTFVYLQVNGVIFDPGLVLDFSDFFYEKNDIKPDFIKKSTAKKEKEKEKPKNKNIKENQKNNIIITDDKNKNKFKDKLKFFEEKNKIKFIKEEKNKNEIIIIEEKENNEIIEKKPKKNEIIEEKEEIRKKIKEEYDKKLNDLKLKANEEKKNMEEEIIKLKNEKKNLQKEIDRQKNDKMGIQLENKQLKEEIKKLKNEDMSLRKEKDEQKNDTMKIQLENKKLKEEIKKLSLEKEKEKADINEKEELKKEIKKLKINIKELEENIEKYKIKKQNLKQQNEQNDYVESSLFDEKLDEIKKKCQEEMNKKYANILNEKMEEIQKAILYDIQQENSQILDTHLKQIKDLKKPKKSKLENKITIEKEKEEEIEVVKEKNDDEEKRYSYELLSDNQKDLEKNIVEFEKEEICFEFKVKNNGDKTWPGNGKTKLIIDNNTDQRINDIELDNLKTNQIQNIKINLNVEGVESGENNYTFNFNVNGKIYGEPIVLKLNVEENEKVQEFREIFSLSKDDYSDRVLYDKLKEVNFNMEEAFSNIFD